MVIGAGSGIGKAIAHSLAKAGADLLLAGRDPGALERTAVELAPYAGSVDTQPVDLAEEGSVTGLALRAGRVDHVISTASAAANGPVSTMDFTAVRTALAAKVIGPLLLAKHLAERIDPAGSMLFFSGVIAWRPAPGRSVMAATNGALAHLVEALALELAPVRVNAISPGIVDSGAWDALPDKDGFLAGVAAKNPARRVGTPADLAEAALFTLTNRFVTGSVVHVDGGGRLA
ncbi:SDR family oxidoreductase [Crossiella cryophila]